MNVAVALSVFLVHSFRVRFVDGKIYEHDDGNQKEEVNFLVHRDNNRV